MNKLIRFLLIFWISFLAIILSMSMTRHVILNGSKINGVPKDIILFFSELLPNISKFSEIEYPMIIKSSSTLNNGFNRSTKYFNNKGYLIISSWDLELKQSVVKLIRIHDGTLIYKWAPNIDSLDIKPDVKYADNNKKSLNKHSTALIHPIILNDGSLIFSTGFVHKIDKFSKVIWSNFTSSHHSVELDSDSSIWICSINSDKRNSEKFQIRDDAIKKISLTDGRILFEKSVFEILMENNYDRGHFFISHTGGASSLDYMHLNDVQPVVSDSKFWRKGDLFLSLRNQNLVFLYRPSSNKIIWSKTGPWLKQHDVDVIDSTRIGIFGNNVIDAKFSNPLNSLIDGHNQQYIYDFSRNEITTPYDNLFNIMNIGTYTGGGSRILSNGNIIIDQNNQGKIICGTFNEEIWTYIEKTGANEISLFGWPRYISEEEFKNYTFIKQKTN